MTQIEELKEIRNLMERSARFLSLSWLSGIFSGIFALAGAIFAYLYLGTLSDQELESIITFQSVAIPVPLLVLLADAALVFVLALAFTLFFTFRKAKKQGLQFWTPASRRLFVNFIVPLITGGAFVLLLMYYGASFLLVPTTLIFYGLALVNSSKFTYSVTFSFGIAEIILGFISAFFFGYGLWFWAAGFGLLHIVYGIIIFLKYDHGTSVA